MPQHKGKDKGTPQESPSGRITPDESKRILEDYIQYRFGQKLSPREFAGKVKVKPDVIQNLLQQQPVDEADIAQVAQALNVSVPLLRQICGFEPISRETLDSLNRFMVKSLHERAREAGGS